MFFGKRENKDVGGKRIDGHSYSSLAPLGKLTEFKVLSHAFGEEKAEVDKLAHLSSHMRMVRQEEERDEVPIEGDEKGEIPQNPNIASLGGREFMKRANLVLERQKASWKSYCWNQDHDPNSSLSEDVYLLERKSAEILAGLNDLKRHQKEVGSEISDLLLQIGDALAENERVLQGLKRLEDEYQRFQSFSSAGYQAVAYRVSTILLVCK